MLPEGIVPTLGPTGLNGLSAGAAFAGAVALGPAASRFLRKRPRATRSVPFACSTLIGLVSTRFAPIRYAFATPACPSTSASASEL